MSSPLKPMDLNKQSSCIVLCGGLSRRMNQDKGSMIINNKPMIIHILETLNSNIGEVIIVLNNKKRISKYKNLINKSIPYKLSYNLIFVEDEIKNKGPLSGMMTGLKHINNSYSLVLPCDSPYINSNYVKSIFKIKKSIKEDYDILIPSYDKSNSGNKNDEIHSNEDKLKLSEPLHGIYNKNLVDDIENLIKKNKLDIKSLIKETNTYFVSISNNFNPKNFKNINQPNDISN
ncbi:MAG: molybdenum cofactor guanylyltransferase [Methanobrevibacter sp.]|jgi:molybdopterin-guanine dinucleotide biosynthesis protein A|nr:molybdenum cofactor guanylyltransferase [Methanobrevibacter sp.]